MERPKRNIKTIVFFFFFSLSGCIWKMQNKKEQEELCANVMRPIFPEISSGWIFQSEG